MGFPGVISPRNKFGVIIDPTKNQLQQKQPCLWMIWKEPNNFETYPS